MSKAEVVNPEVVEETKAVVKAKSAETGDSRAVIKKAIARQVNIVQGVELRSNFEKLKLGAMVSEAVRQLKLDDPAANRGRNSEGGGALGWWSEVCPKDDAGEPQIAYKTVMMWKQAAERLPEILCTARGGGAVKNAEVLALLAKNPKKVFGKNAKILSSAEKVANGMTMRQMLLWGGDEEAKGKGAKKAVKDKKDFTMPTPEESAKRIWSDLKLELENSATQKSIADLEPEWAAVMAEIMKRLLKKFEDRAARA